MGAVTFTVVAADFTRAKEKMERAKPKAEHAMANEFAKLTSPFVPFLTGSQDIRTRVDGNTIIYAGPYAHYIHEGVLYVDPGTGSPWAKKGVTKRKTSKKLKYGHAFHPQATDHWDEKSKAVNAEKIARVAGEVIKHEF